MVSISPVGPVTFFGNFQILDNIGEKKKMMPSICVGSQVLSTRHVPFADTHVILKNPAWKSLAQRNLKHKVPSVRGLISLVVLTIYVYIGENG